LNTFAALFFAFSISTFLRLYSQMQVLIGMGGFPETIWSDVGKEQFEFFFDNDGDHCLC